jgi:putative endonuclease
MALWRSPVRARYGPQKDNQRIVLFIFMFTVYKLQSNSNSQYYIGQTTSIPRCLEEHNTGLSKYTRNHRPWSFVYSKECATRSEAIKRELEIKRMKNRKYIEVLIKGESVPTRLSRDGKVTGSAPEAHPPLAESPVRSTKGQSEDCPFYFTEEEKNDCNTNQIILTE